MKRTFEYNEVEFSSRLLNQVKSKSDHLMNYFIGGYFIVGLILAAVYDTWLIAIGVGGILVLAYYSAKFLLPLSNLYQYVLSVVVGIFMAQYIYQMHGMFEMHFFAFIGSAILVTYQNWKLQIPLAVVVILHHAVFGYLQFSGYGVYFTQMDYMSLQTFGIHGVLSVMIFFICGLWSYNFKESSLLQIRQSFEIGQLLEEGNQKNALIEERKRSEEVLSKSNERFNLVSKATHDYIYDWDLKTGELIRTGDGLKELFGYEAPLSAYDTSFWQSKIHEDDIKVISENIHAAIAAADRQFWELEYRFRKADGAYAYVNDKGYLMRNEHGQAVRIIGAVQDITQRKESEFMLKKLNEQLGKRAEELAISNEELEQFAYIASHDL